MSRFYGMLDGKAQTTATREGTAASGIQAHVSGWDIGIKVQGHTGTIDGKEADIFRVSITRGSHDSTPFPLVGTFALILEDKKKRVLKCFQCRACKGSGRVPDGDGYSPCRRCSGDGETWKEVK